MMDYYQELGVEHAASPDEIRQAYKHLARLLHPDHCGDEQSRRLADLQMKRLNGMLQVLTNPVDRQRYDRSLLSRTPTLSGPPGSLDWKAPKWLWPVLGAILLAGILSSLMRTPRPAALTAGAHEAAAGQVASPPEPNVSRPHAQERPVRDSARARPETIPEPAVLWGRRSAPRARYGNRRPATFPSTENGATGSGKGCPTATTKKPGWSTSGNG